MDEEIIVLCKFGFETLVLQISRSFGFKDLIGSLVRNWHLLLEENLVLSYAIPGHSNCFLRSQIELNNMISIVLALRLSHVDVNVGDRSLGMNVDVVEGGISSVTIPEKEVCLLEGNSSASSMLMSSSWANGIRGVGQVFEGGVGEFRIALCRYASELGFKFNYVRNNKKRVIAQCAKKFEIGCQWQVYATVSSVNGFAIIKELQKEHTCQLVVSNASDVRMSSKILSGLIIDQIRQCTLTSAVSVISYMKNNYGLTVSYDKAWRALEKAKATVFGDSAESFNQLRWYINVATKFNPGSHFVLDVDDDTKRFRRLFVSFHASIHGFNFCRAMLFIDGTFLKGRFKGTLLSATGKDGNQGLFPLAFSVVDAENHDNWLWFFEELRKIIVLEREVTFVSDRHVGIMEALPKVFSRSHHFFCMQHLKANLRDKFSGKGCTNSFRERVVHLFRECAYAPTRTLFAEKLAMLKLEGGAPTLRFLEGLPPECWSNAYSRGCRYGEMTSNAAESFNAWIVDARNLPITEMVDHIRTKLMEWFIVRKKEASEWNGFLCPRMNEKLQAYAYESRVWVVKKSSEFVFEVISDPSVCVDIGKRTCSCNLWQINGFPCVHAVAAINRSGLPMNEVVDCCFHVGTYRMTYEESVHAIPRFLRQEFEESSGSKILPPNTKRLAGRPKKKRFRSKGELVRRIRCGRCGCLGNHNKKTCKEPLN